MPKYYTSTHMYSAEGRVGISWYDHIPALLFFDPDADLPFEEAHAAARGHFGHDGPLLANAWHLPKTRHAAWFFASEWRTPDVSGVIGDKDFAPLLVRADGATEVLPLARRYAHCGRLEQLLGACPCLLSKQSAEEGKFTYLSNSLCQVQSVFEKQTLVPVASLIPCRDKQEIYKGLPKYLGEFRYIEERQLHGTIRAPEGQWIHRASFNAAWIEEQLEELSARAVIAAKTRAFRKNECARCALTCKERAARCEGRVRVPQVEIFLESLLLRDTRYRRISGYTEKQQDFLATFGGRAFTTTTLSTSTGRSRRYTLGFFTKHGAYRVFRPASCRESDTYEDVVSWNSLVYYFPDVLELYERWCEWGTPLPRWAWRAYMAAVLRPWRRKRAFRSWVEQPLTRVSWDGRRVSVYYRHINWPTREWREEHSAGDLLEAYLPGIGPDIDRTCGLPPRLRKDKA